MRNRLHFPDWWGIYTPKSLLLVRCYPYEIDFANRFLKTGDSTPRGVGFLLRRIEPSLVSIQVWSYRLSTGFAFPLAQR